MTDQELDAARLWFRLMDTDLTYDAHRVYLRAQGFPLPRDARLPAVLKDVQHALVDLFFLERARHDRHS